MCGIFGAIGKRMNQNLLDIISTEAGRRGPQAYGIAWKNDGKIEFRKENCKISTKKAFKNVNTDALIGNCRLSTSGTPMDLRNNQPMLLNDMAVSHNGNVKDYLQIAKDIGAELQSDCDSEIICHMIEKFGIEDTIEQLSDSMPAALLILHNNKITAFRKGQPLYHYEKDGCHYFCSRKFYDAKLLKEDTVLEFEGGN